MSFQIHALPADKFQHLFSLSDEELAATPAERRTAHIKPGYPCRVSLEDAEVGEEVILLHYQHQPVDTAYRSSHAIFVRANAQEARPGIDEIPESLAIRLLSVRGFSAAHQMVAADVVHGRELRDAINQLFENEDVSYLHIHNAKPGCFAARVTRA
jgi:hypothetical protein